MSSNEITLTGYFTLALTLFNIDLNEREIFVKVCYIFFCCLGGLVDCLCFCLVVRWKVWEIAVSSDLAVMS